MWLLSLVLSPLSACRPDALRPADPLQPKIRPELAGCTWTRTGDQHEDGDGSYRPAFTLVETYDGDGRLTERTWTTTTVLPTGAQRSSESVERLTWTGRCPTESSYESIRRYSDLPDADVTLSASTTCDDYGNPIEVTSESRTVTTDTDRPTESRSVTRYDNTYAARRLVERARLDEQGGAAGFVERFRWDGERVVASTSVDPLTPEAAAAVGEAGADGVLTEESTWSWDGDRLVEETTHVEHPEPLLTVRTYLYDDGGRWLGDDTTSGPDRGLQGPSHSVRYEYSQRDRFPLRQRQENTTSAANYEDHIEVRCE